MTRGQRWTGIGYANVPGRVLRRARWNQTAIVVELRGGELTVAVNLPLLRSVQRRVLSIGAIAYAQDADRSGGAGPYIPGVRIVCADGSVSYIWLGSAHKVRAALASEGVEVLPPMEDASPGRLGRRQYDP